ncbi:unnamed protein product [Scytosiphon promiscuus]
MGIVLSRVFQALFGSKEVRILILGLDNAGKTTILYRLQNEADDNIQTIPTIGFNVETLQYKNIKFQQVWDLGGQTSIRPYWRCYYPNTDAIVFVRAREGEEETVIASCGLRDTMDGEEELKDAILLVFANKQDQPGSLSSTEASTRLDCVSEALGLPEIRSRQWSIQEASALKGKGLFEGFDWLVTCIKGGEA